MMDDRPPGLETRGAGFPARKTDPDHEQRPQFDSTTPPAPEGLRSNVVQLRRPVRRAVCIVRKAGHFSSGKAYSYIVHRRGWLGVASEPNSFSVDSYEKARDCALRLAAGGMPILDYTGEWHA